ncbi:hypothetical protein RO3G_05965 [Rhizopus delemar RA 99-880]|uniref:Efficient mitochondria targeting-associated protein 19 n=1 Tax=Rhizopus delemar (strain RA 99-880 / ATCC MYA-4621 / FGSC 9543 / NRRL 43880) TaxID=246409 RepID=I1BYI0_RHIO9|nr:hypothetical protein RO3G_05965 [Rhizopus delemar RA 99-880]|eukprot:EIE81260.1 hypothetical protein RO3G_05965 [Rhizopus delemar RA 99-880]
MTKSGLLSRPLDLIYFVYFATHIPITLCIDLQTFCPSSWVPNTLVDLFHFYKITFKDPLMGSSEPMYWYLSFLVCELVIQLPFFFAACYGLFKVYGAHVTTTVLPTLAEVMLNPTYSLVSQERWVLFGFYFPYFLLPFIMLIDSYRCVNQSISLAQSKKSKIQ